MGEGTGDAEAQRILLRARDKFMFPSPPSPPSTHGLVPLHKTFQMFHIKTLCVLLAGSELLHAEPPQGVCYKYRCWSFPVGPRPWHLDTAGWGSLASLGTVCKPPNPQPASHLSATSREGSLGASPSLPALPRNQSSEDFSGPWESPSFSFYVKDSTQDQPAVYRGGTQLPP